MSCKCEICSGQHLTEDHDTAIRCIDRERFAMDIIAASVRVEQEIKLKDAMIEEAIERAMRTLNALGWDALIDEIWGLNPKVVYSQTWMRDAIRQHIESEARKRMEVK